MSNPIQQLCDAPAGRAEVLQGNIAFAVGCVRGGIHCADGYPGTPSSEVIDKGLSQVQDLIKVGWSVNEAVASAVGVGHSLAGDDCVVTMKIPGLFQAADIFTSGSVWSHARGALVYYVAADFTPSSTQHIIDPHYLFKSCFVPVLEPRNHQEMHLAAGIAAEISRTFRTQVVVMPSGVLCHSEGLVRMMPREKHEPLTLPGDLRAFNVLPNLTRGYYDAIMDTRLPALEEMVEKSPLNHWTRGAGKKGVVTYGVCDLYVREVMEAHHLDLDVLSLAFSNPLPMKLLREFHASIEGEVVVLEDGYRFVQEAMEQAGLAVGGKDPHSRITEWSPALVAERLGVAMPGSRGSAASLKRPPVICPGCPYRLFAGEIASLKKRNQLDAAFGDIGCNSLLYFMNAMDTGLAMGASEAKRIGYVVSRPDKAGRCVSIIGDSTECHSGLDATRNAVYRNVPGVKVILDNEWTAMTGGQPSPTSPANLAGQAMKFDLPATLAAHGAKVVVIGAYDRKAIKSALKSALAEAEQGVYTTLVLRDGACLRRSRPSTQRVAVDPAACRKCGLCLICPGLEPDAQGVPVNTNLCSGCGGHVPACSQMCPTGVLKSVELEDVSAPGRAFPAPPAILPPASRPEVPGRLSVAIRGVGGQGNLFFGKVLTQVALLAGCEDANIVKGETHGMAQMGGPVISTFGCGSVKSPVLLPGTADVLIAMEKSEVLRPGFLEMLRPGGTVLLAGTRILPAGLGEKDYPTDAAIQEALEGRRVVEVDVLGRALALGDATGRVANVVMLGVLSTLEPFDAFPESLWCLALQKLNPKPAVWASNYAAFMAGRG
ncbi:MAG TPA: 2-oxoacid:acceptor oxidoreductase family protein [Holophaga sp.]|nr:2-oxoacid:acceptor oxidoreductase family protein [Holophaga sp.]HPS68698.1 2-oxoacid:acceptor oxidoreductase family protein [Holophaga sp.]